MIRACNHISRSTFPSRWERTARSAPNTASTRCRSTRPERPRSSDRESEDMMPSRRVLEVRPSPSSERRQRPPRRLPSSLSAQSARQEDSTPSSVASHSCSERRTSQRVAPSSEEARFGSGFNDPLLKIEGPLSSHNLALYSSINITIN